MNGEEFFSLAVTLSAGATPAEMRSTVSRAYYGAFHTAADLIRSTGIGLPNSSECHNKVIQVLGAAEDAEVEVVSCKIGSLRSTRNRADYDVQEPKYEKKLFAIQQLKLAEEVITSIKASFADPAKTGMRDKLREFAKNKLQLPVAPK
jgi:uncharacterized protein (UPF0332 family)